MKPKRKPEIKRTKKGTVTDSASARELRGLRKGLPNTKKSFDAICKILDREDRRMIEKKNGKVPEGVPLTPYLLIRKFRYLTLRENKKAVVSKCPNCKKKHDVFIPDMDGERNSIKAGSVLFDRFAPKLASTHIDVDVHETVGAVSEIIIKAIIKYVPDAKRSECITEINQLFEKIRNAQQD